MNGSQWNGAIEAPAPGSGQMAPAPRKKRKRWPLLLMGAGGSVTIWGGWVGLGRMTGFGRVNPLPGIWDSLHINTIITLPVGMEAYAAYGFGVWLDRAAPPRARRFAMWSSIVSACLGMAGQAEYHHLVTTHQKVAPGWVVMAVSCLPVMAVVFGAILYHLQGEEKDGAGSHEDAAPKPEPVPSAPLEPTAALEPAVTEPAALEPLPAVTEPTPVPSLPPIPQRTALEPVKPEPVAGVSGPPPVEPVSLPVSPKPVPPRAIAGPVNRPAQTVGGRRIVLRDAAELLPKAEEINNRWRELHGKDISGNKLSEQMRIHKTTASALMKAIKAARADGDEVLAQ